MRELIQAALQGQKAQRAGAPLSDNPFVKRGKADRVLHQAWAEGFLLSEIESHPVENWVCFECGRLSASDSLCKRCNLPLIPVHKITK